MSCFLFIFWVVLVFVVADLVGTALRQKMAGTLGSRAVSFGVETGDADAAGALQFAHSTLLGFAALWVGLSLAYALGIATQAFMLAFIILAGLAAAVLQRGYLFSLVRVRLLCWGLLALMVSLALFFTPQVNVMDDPQYLFLVEKLLQTGSVVEYFSYRRPITLGGWTFLQAIFSSGPAGTAFISSLDFAVGGVFFLLAALLLRLSPWVALPAALCAMLVTQIFQVNLGASVTMAALCALLVGLSLPTAGVKGAFLPMSFAVLAVTVRPQLGLLALLAVAICLWRNRSHRLLLQAAILAGISAVWIAIFYRDTSLLPLSVSPGFNPILDPAWDRFSNNLKLPRKFVTLWRRPYIQTTFSLAVFAVVLCAWQSLRRRTNDHRDEFGVLFLFSIAALVTAVVMIEIDGVLAVQHTRYYVPVLQGFLFVFLVRGGIHALREGLYQEQSAFVPVALLVCALGIVNFIRSDRISPPAESSGRICSPLAGEEDERSLGQIPTTQGLTLLMINCPLGSIEMHPRLMLSDLFFMTRGELFDVQWETAEIAKWFQGQGVSQLVYLANDTSPVYGLQAVRELLAYYQEDQQKYRTWEFEFWLRSLEIPRSLAGYCESSELPVNDAQGPLVIVNLEACNSRP